MVFVWLLLGNDINSCAARCATFLPQDENKHNVDEDEFKGYDTNDDGALNMEEVHEFQFADITDPLTHIQEVDEEIAFLMHQLVNDADASDASDVKTMTASKNSCHEQMHIFVHTVEINGHEEL